MNLTCLKAKARARARARWILHGAADLSLLCSVCTYLGL